MAQGSNVAANIAYEDLREWLALAERLERSPSIVEAGSEELALADRLLREEIGADEYVAGREALRVGE